MYIHITQFDRVGFSGNVFHDNPRTAGFLEKIILQIPERMALLRDLITREIVHEKSIDRRRNGFRRARAD